MHDARQHEHPRQHHHQEIGVLGDQRERHNGVEQHRQLELVAVVGGPLGGIVRPVDATHRQIGVAAVTIHAHDGARTRSTP